MNGRHYERGGTLVETAIVLSLMLALLFGIIDFGRALYAYHTVAYMARAGARWAMVRGSACPNSGEVGETQCPALASDIATYVDGLGIGLDPTHLTVDTATSDLWPGTGTGCIPPSNPPDNTPGCPVVVTVSYNFQFLLPYMPNFTIPMSSTSTMVIQQ